MLGNINWWLAVELNEEKKVRKRTLKEKNKFWCFLEKWFTKKKGDFQVCHDRSSYGSNTTSSYCTSSLSCCPLDSCCFKESPLPQPHANQVFEHAGMWLSIVHPIVWAHKGGLCAWKLRLAKIQRGQAYAISEAQWGSRWQRAYCQGPQCALSTVQCPNLLRSLCMTGGIILCCYCIPHILWHKDLFILFYLLIFLSDRWPQLKRPKRKQLLLMLPKIRWKRRLSSLCPLQKLNLRKHKDPFSKKNCRIFESFQKQNKTFLSDFYLKM